MAPAGINCRKSHLDEHSEDPGHICDMGAHIALQPAVEANQQQLVHSDHTADEAHHGLLRLVGLIALLEPQEQLLRKGLQCRSKLDHASDFQICLGNYLKLAQGYKLSQATTQATPHMGSIRVG